MGRIPNFTNTIFPASSIHLLTLTSTIGLVFFLFIVAIELDASLAKRNAKASLAISVSGLVIPLGLGAAIAVPIYHQFVDSSVNYGYFILFVAVAVGITAFPVLCRILTETRLLDTTVGVLVLSAGIGNDVTGWVLLALTVALVNASTGLTAFYVLLTGVGYTIFLLFPVSWAFRWLARRSGSLEKGEPTAFMMTITLILVLFSAFFTDIIGIHPIFGQLLLVLPILVILKSYQGGFLLGW
jgi:Kef-type K+ transport system membrane component KefB